MENLIVGKTIRRNQDGSYYYEWFPLNEELLNTVIHGQDFNTKQEASEYEVIAHTELVNCINSKFDQPLYQVNQNSLEHSLYIKRREDGIQAVDALMGELRNLAKSNPDQELARTINRHIENAFEKVTLNVRLGWWITAKEQCELVPIGGYITQELWNRIYNTIITYISENY